MPLFRLTSPGPFFDNKVRAFWNLQILGWAAWLGLRGVSGLANGQAFTFLIPQVISAITGFSLTLILSVCYRALINRRPLLMWGVSFGLAGLATALWAFIDAWVAQIQNPASEAGFTSLLLGAVYIDATSLAAWSALYFAINYFLQLEEQNDRVLRLEAQAASAQLAMLRYQLNPHFLFNTLNSLSTLVLKGSKSEAETMIMNLSSFLRSSLAVDPEQLVSLDEEIALQRLYLDIEQARFPDRLQVEVSMPDELKHACVPVLILQPIIENAIKYGVSPSKGKIAIRLQASAEYGLLVLRIENDIDPKAPVPASGTGLGLGNVRERLLTRYGPAAGCEWGKSDDGGFVVSLWLPLAREAC